MNTTSSAAFRTKIEESGIAKIIYMGKEGVEAGRWVSMVVFQLWGVVENSHMLLLLLSKYPIIYFPMLEFIDFLLVFAEVESFSFRILDF